MHSDHKGRTAADKAENWLLMQVPRVHIRIYAFPNNLPNAMQSNAESKVHTE